MSLLSCLVPSLQVPELRTARKAGHPTPYGVSMPASTTSASSSAPSGAGEGEVGGWAKQDNGPDWRAVIADLETGAWLRREDGLEELLKGLSWSADHYLLGYDFPSYVAAQEEADRVWKDQYEWTRRSILSSAGELLPH